MCGRFTLATPVEDLVKQFSIAEVAGIEARYNIAPSQAVAAVREEKDKGGRELVWLQWGLVPFWADDPKIGFKMINARAETVDRSNAFRYAFQRRRCLVLADGFYEWRTEEGQKQPYYIQMEDGRPFGFAGLWEAWKDEEKDRALESCTIITTNANELVRPVHPRMPAILHPDNYDLWLDMDAKDTACLKEMVLRPFPPEEMTIYRVSRRVNRPDQEGRELIEPMPAEA
ncbi:MAG: SOS response-associated peptidase [Anaerolineae bacterium]|nr:SOS response-associated peptidase [Anaerolineae bacterium]